ncbi:hypothetical protein ZWY2020_032698 [Hordeum vulgare]|nr:hypothetical protein ZWY2020_032698 [Hordeum vulgare]
MGSGRRSGLGRSGRGGADERGDWAGCWASVGGARATRGLSVVRLVVPEGTGLAALHLAAGDGEEVPQEAGGGSYGGSSGAWQRIRAVPTGSDAGSRQGTEAGCGAAPAGRCCRSPARGAKQGRETGDLRGAPAGQGDLRRGGSWPAPAKRQLLRGTTEAEELGLLLGAAPPDGSAGPIWLRPGGWWGRESAAWRGGEVGRRGSREVMASNLTSDEVAEQNMAFEEDDDVFITEEIEDSLGDQQVEQVMTLEPKKGLMFDSEDDAVRFYKGSRKSKSGQESNPLSSQQTEELETSEPATSIHIKSYIDILQGNKDVMDLLDANSNG